MIRPEQMQLTPRELVALVTLLILSVLPHLLHLNPWISAFFIATVLLRLAALKNPRALPGRWLLFLLTIGGVVNVLSHYPVFFGKDAGVALLASMLALKLMELKTRRDLFITIFLAFFCLITQFLFRQEILLTLYVFLVAAGLTAVLVEVSRIERSRSLLQPLMKSGSLLLQAVPIMVVMFIFFPRLSGPLWNLGVDEATGVTGLSDRIRPGTISKLIRSKAVAFRVEFESEAPPPEKRYWRGPVLLQTDGFTWMEGVLRRPRPLEFTTDGNQIRYTVTMEPTRQKWLFGLDLPDSLPPNALLLPDFQLINLQPHDRRIRYSLTSSTEYNTGDISRRERERALRLPDNVTPRMLDLVDSWQQMSREKSTIVDLGLNHFRQQEFYYTLYPPLMIENPADEFLFDQRRGFCEHYSTSFALLMRLAGIPSRVVTGYQGGELNPIDNILTVRQSDAHAWVEVWLEGHGWVRVDPTAAVAPERIERTFDFEIDDELGALGIPIDFSQVDSDFMKSMAQRFRWSLEALNSSWQRWVLGYSDQRQGNLMDIMGLSFIKGYKLGIAMVMISAVLVLALGALLWGRTRERKDPVLMQYERFCDRMAKVGLIRSPAEGPKDFARRSIKQRPDLTREISRITGLYIGLRYGSEYSDALFRKLVRNVKAFRPGN